jgi:hypothetical protein
MSDRLSDNSLQREQWRLADSATKFYTKNYRRSNVYSQVSKELIVLG